MKNHNIILKLTVIFVFLSCNSTKSIFIEYKENSKGKCYYDSMYNDGRNKKLIKYEYRNCLTDDKLNEFEICNTFFKEIPKTKQKISKRKYLKLTISSIDSLLRLREDFTKELSVNFIKRKKTKKKVFKKYNFKLFIVERKNDSIVNIYEVYIIDKSYKNHEPKELYEFDIK